MLGRATSWLRLTTTTRLFLLRCIPSGLEVNSGLFRSIDTTAGELDWPDATWPRLWYRGLLPAVINAPSEQYIVSVNGVTRYAPENTRTIETRTT